MVKDDLESYLNATGHGKTIITLHQSLAFKDLPSGVPQDWQIQIEKSLSYKTTVQDPANRLIALGERLNVSNE